MAIQMGAVVIGIHRSEAAVEVMLTMAGTHTSAEVVEGAKQVHQLLEMGAILSTAAAVEETELPQHLGAAAHLSLVELAALAAIRRQQHPALCRVAVAAALLQVRAAREQEANLEYGE